MSRAESQKGKTSHTNAFLVSAYVTSPNISLAKVVWPSPKSRDREVCHAYPKTQAKVKSYVQSPGLPRHLCPKPRDRASVKAHLV